MRGGENDLTQNGENRRKGVGGVSGRILREGSLVTGKPRPLGSDKRACCREPIKGGELPIEGGVGGRDLLQFVIVPIRSKREGSADIRLLWRSSSGSMTVTQPEKGLKGERGEGLVRTSKEEELQGKKKKVLPKHPQNRKACKIQSK